MFPDYSPSELFEIFEGFAAKGGYDVPGRFRGARRRRATIRPSRASPVVLGVGGLRGWGLSPLGRLAWCCGCGALFPGRYPGISGSMVQEKAGFI